MRFSVVIFFANLFGSRESVENEKKVESWVLPTSLFFFVFEKKSSQLGGVAV